MALHHAVAGERVRLASIANPDAKTAALVKNDTFEAAQLFLRSGDTIAAHSVAGFVTVHCLEGSVTLHAATDVKLKAGEWMYLDRGQRHSVSAQEDSSFLLTFLFE